MLLKRVWAKKLYGNLNPNLALREGINLLVGINGSGKTTVLNLSNALLTLNIGVLATTPFAEFGMELEVNDVPISIRCTQKLRDLHIHGSQNGEALHPIHVALKVKAADLPESPMHLAELRERYGALGPEPDEESLWNLIKSIEKPLTILLDRTISILESDLISVDGVRARKGHAALEPTSHVKTLARDAYAKYQYQLIRLNDRLKAKLITSSFETGASAKRTKLLTLEQVTAIESKLLHRMSVWNPESTDALGVKNYFRRFRDIVTSLKSTKVEVNRSFAMINLFFADEMKRIVGLSDAFEEFENASAKLYEPLKRYLDSLNNFFKDTGKELAFDETTNSLYFRRAEKEPASPSQRKSLTYLSSGERQILILLTYIAFPPLKASVFVIDEPELSLHPKWQHELLRNVEKLMSPNTQMIIATHSPEIVGRHTERCIQL